MISSTSPLSGETTKPLNPPIQTEPRQPRRNTSGAVSELRKSFTLHENVARNAPLIRGEKRPEIRRHGSDVVVGSEVCRSVSTLFLRNDELCLRGNEYVKHPRSLALASLDPCPKVQFRPNGHVHIVQHYSPEEQKT